MAGSMAGVKIGSECTSGMRVESESGRAHVRLLGRGHFEFWCLFEDLACLWKR